MAKIITIHSFRRSTGKSNVAANLAVLWAAEGYRVGIIDIGRQFADLQMLFGQNQPQTPYSFNDYLDGKCGIKQAVQNITASLNINDINTKGQLFLLSSRPHLVHSTQALPAAYDAELLGQSFYELGEVLGLDLLILDTYAGLHEISLISMTFADVLVILLRPDWQDYQGTAITVQLTRHLDIPHALLVVNVVPASFDAVGVKSRVEEVYNCQVAAVLPYSHELMMLANKKIFVLCYPDHPLTGRFKGLAAKLGV